MFRSLLVTCAMVVIVPTVLRAQDCADWSDTTPMPLHDLRINARAAVAVDGLLVTADDSLRIYSIEPDELPMLGSIDLSDLIVSRARLISGQVFLACDDDGIWQVDLADPAWPAVTPVFTPETGTTDLAGFDGGVIVVAATGEFYVLDGLGEGQRNVLSQGVAGDSCGTVAAVGTTACIVHNALVTVDLADPMFPLVGGSTYCPPDAPSGTPWINDIVIIEGQAFAPARYYWPLVGESQQFIQKFDISDPENPTAVACRQVDFELQRFSVQSGLLVALSRYTVALLNPGDLRTIAAVAIPEKSYNSGNLVSHADELFMVDEEAGTWRFSRVPDTINPVFSMDPLFDHGSGARFAIRAGGRRGVVGGGIHFTQIFDQTDPQAPILVYEEEFGVGEDSSYSSGLETQVDRWAIMKRSYGYDDGNVAYGSASLKAISESGSAHLLGSSTGIYAVPDGETLWVVGESFWTSDTLEAFDLSGDQPVSLGVTGLDQFPIPNTAGQPHVFADQLLLFGQDIAVFDPTDPAAPVHVDTVTPAHARGPFLVGPVDDGVRLIAHTYAGIEVFSAEDSNEHPIAVRGYLEIETNAYVSAMTLNGDLLAVGHRTGWSLVSIANPDAPLLVASVPGSPVKGIIWIGDHLYVSSRQYVFLYDVSDPGAPTWVGQAAAVDWSYGSLGVRSDLLLAGHRVLPLDCSDLLSIDDDITDDSIPAIPTAVRLHSPSPNPFNPVTTLSFDLTRSEHTTITIHDLRGRAVATLAEAPFARGSHTLTWNGTDTQGRALPSGTYLVRLVTESAVRTTKAVLIR